MGQKSAKSGSLKSLFPAFFCPFFSFAFFLYQQTTQKTFSFVAFIITFSKYYFCSEKKKKDI